MKSSRRNQGRKVKVPGGKPKVSKYAAKTRPQITLKDTKPCIS